MNYTTRVKIQLILPALLLLNGFAALGQHNLSGRISDLNNNPVVGSNVIVYNLQSAEIFNYTTSNNTGNFSIVLNDLKDSLRLEVTCVGFEKKSLAFAYPHDSLWLHITLSPSTVLLADVVITQDTKPISVRGDTINYSVKSFIDSSDRVIADVLKKIPGISITASGQILFNNRAINKFYIEGLDLLDSRYNIATNNLPAKDVEQIQVLPNHQPIKVLDSVLISGRAAINIKLKKGAKSKLLGTASAGLGLPISNRDDQLALLEFSKDFQFINVLKTNNTGINLDQELTEQNFSANYYESGSIKQDLVSLIKPSPPPLDQNRYWFNNNNLANTNLLVKLSKQFNLRFNFAFENDKLSENPSSLTRIYLPIDTISIQESHTTKNAYSKIIGGVTLQTNQERLYLENALKLQSISSNGSDLVLPVGINQLLKNPYTNFSNNLAAIIKVKDQTVGFNSFTAYTVQPQSLVISPGLYENVLNSGLLFDGLLQTIKTKTFFINNTATYSKKLKEFSIVNTIGISNLIKNLNNNLLKMNGSVSSPIDSNYQNNIGRQQSKLYENASISYNQSRLNVSLNLNNSFNRYTNTGVNINQQLSKLLLNPQFSLKYTINAYFENSFTIAAESTLKAENNSSYILTDYRDLISDDSPINSISNQNISYQLIYKNIVRGIFLNFNVLYAHHLSHFISFNTYTGVLSKLYYVAAENPSDDLNMSVNIDKYYEKIKTKIDLGVSYGSGRLQEIQQNIFTTLKSNTYTFNSTINTNFTESMALTHQFTTTIYQSSAAQASTFTAFDPIYTIKQNFLLRLFLPDKFQAHLNIEQYITNVNKSTPGGVYFTDIVFKKTFKKPDIDFSMSLSNLFNVKNYTSYIYLNNTFISANYPLRGRMFLARLLFQL